MFLTSCFDITASDSPKNFKTNWNDVNNSLILQWDHPDITNGPIVAFDIEIYCSEYAHFKDSLQVIHDQLNYTKAVSNKS